MRRPIRATLADQRSLAGFIWRLNVSQKALGHRADLFRSLLFDASDWGMDSHQLRPSGNKPNKTEKGDQKQLSLNPSGSPLGFGAWAREVVVLAGAGPRPIGPILVPFEGR